MSKPRAIVGWSGGKDSTWALHTLRQSNEYEIAALVTSINAYFQRVAVHGTRVALVEQQALATGIPLWQVPLPWPCTNEDYERAMTAAIARAVGEGVTHFAFGDLFLEDIRAYREKQLSGTGLTPLFPCWGLDTASLAQEMLAAGLRTRLTALDLKKLPITFAGREFDAQLLANLPAGIDPCGERGEFHTFCFDAPVFANAIPCHYDHTIEREGFAYAELLPGWGDSETPVKHAKAPAEAGA